MNIFKRCTQQLPEPSLWDDDVTVDDIVRKLFLYFGGFQCLIEAKTEIETKCEMEEKENYWSESDIKKAWRERERMDRKKKSAIKHWSRVIVLEELRRRLYNDKCKQRQAETDVKEDEKTQACGNATRKIGKTDKISFNTKPSMVSEDRQIDIDYKKTRNNEEQVGINLIGTKRKLQINDPHICIPLSIMSDNEKHSTLPDYDEPIESPYKLTDGCPKLLNGQPSENEIRKRKSYVISYNNKTNNANWVYEILNRSTLAKNYVDVRFEDDYQRGHLAAAANHKWCLKAHEDASLFSNIAPQLKTLNNGVWKSLENKCRADVKYSVRNVHVYTGPCYSRENPKDQVFMKEKALPDNFFKVIIVEHDNGAVDVPECYLIPNENLPKGNRYEDYQCDIDDIEKASGLTFLDYFASVTTASINKISWEGIKWDKMGKGDNEGLYTADIEVRIFS